MTGDPVAAAAAAADMPGWLAEVLHVCWGFASCEHQRGSLVAAHALAALEQVPAEVLAAARVGRPLPGQLVEVRGR